MTTERLVEACDTIISRVESKRGNATALLALEFLRKYAGKESEFYRGAVTRELWGDTQKELLGVLNEFREYVKAGFADGISPVEQARIDVVSDILQQAARLLAEKKTHPAAAAVLIGASLEEYLRVWCEREHLITMEQTLTIDAYAKKLLHNGKIGKQEIKDITAWAGHRNNAAHGHWNLVENAQQISIMLDGVNLFMRQCTP